MTFCLLFFSCLGVEIQDLKQIIELMKCSELTELEIEEANLKLRLRRELASEGAVCIERPMKTVVYEASDMQPHVAPVAHALPAHAPVDDKTVSIIKSPMVGTFYRASSPESTPFVSLGASVQSETVVCIIEAMKVLNEIHAEMTGTVLEILVENGQSVEYGQPLFKIKQG